MLKVSDARKMCGIHINKIPIELEKCEPTKLDPKEITKQLNNIGLQCDETRGEKLEKNIEEVANKIGTGKLTTFGVYFDKGEMKVESIAEDKLIKLRQGSVGTMNELLEERYEKQADGTWSEGKLGQFTSKLQVIQQKDNFNYLKENAPDFPYAEFPLKTEKKYVTTVDAIKDMFTQAALACVGATVDGIDDITLKAVFSNVMEAINESVFSEDYDASNNRVIMLLLNYDPKTSECDGVGAVTVEWRLRIKNYKKKKHNPKHETILDIEARSVLYTDIDMLDKHYAMVIGRHKPVSCICEDSIKIISEVEVFDQLPPASMETFIKSLPCESDTNHADAMVFYAADVQKLGFIDNTLADADATYTKSITSGFMTQTTVGFSMELNFEINAEVVKCGTKFGFNASLTDQWSKTQTDTISFQVPAGKRAFLYQVTMLCARLRLDSATGKYSYVDYGKFLTDAYKTTDKPLYEDKM